MNKLLFILALTLASLNTHAIPLSDLLSGQTIIAGDKLFDQWSILSTGSSDQRTVNTGNIEVSALIGGGLDPGPGLHFELLNDEFLLEGDGAGAFLEFVFGFRVTVLDPGFLIKDNSLYLTAATLINPSELTRVYIEEFIFGDSARSDLLGVKDVEFSRVYDAQGNLVDQTTKTFDSAEFDPRSSIYVTKNILIEASALGEFARLESFEQRFSQTAIPVPGSSLLLGLGLFALFLSKKVGVKINPSV